MRFLEMGEKLFYKSLGLGILLWLFIFLITPVDVMEGLKIKTIAFIVLSYLSLVLGFWVIPSKKFQRSSKDNTKGKLWVFNVLVVIVILSFVLRWIDLFFYRDITFGVDPKSNRLTNLGNFGRSNILFILPSILKGLYFFPLVLWLFDAINGLKKQHLIFSILVLCLPIVEAIVFGTRKPFMEILLIVITTIVVSGNFYFSIRKMLAFVAAFILVLVISVTILFQRESVGVQEKNEFYERILSAEYNKILKPKESVVSYIKDNSSNETLRMGALILLQTGQYFVHGLYEFNHIIDNDIPTTKGAYTFYPFFKLVQKLEGKDVFVHNNPSPKKIVYLTTFGGFFIDFKWFSLAVFFVFGIFQKLAFAKCTQDYFYLPIVIYFLIINVFLLAINYLSGQGIYPFVAFGLLLGTFVIIEKRIHGKSINT